MPSSELSNDSEPRLLPTLKEYALFAPAIGGGLAVAFDVGFFYGLQSGFFTAFSLSEHLVSALYVTPVALFLFVVGALVILLVIRLRPAGASAKIGVLSLVAGTIVVPSITSFMRSDYFLTGSFCVIVLVMVPLVFAKTRYQWELALLFAAPIIGLCLSFILGVSWAHGDSTDSAKYSKIEMTVGDPMLGTVVRTGDKGVLLFADKGFILVPWTNIRSVRNQFETK